MLFLNPGVEPSGCSDDKRLAASTGKSNRVRSQEMPFPPADSVHANWSIVISSFFMKTKVLAVAEPIAKGTVALDRQHKEARGIAFRADSDVVCSFVIRIHDERVCARRQHGTCKANGHVGR